MAWAALAAIGHLASLAMIDAGPVLRYQHYRPFGVLLADSPGLLAIVGGQALAVGLAIARRVAAMRRGSERFPVVRVGLAIALTVITAATVSPDPRRYVAELAFAASLQLLSILTILLAVLAIPRPIASRWAHAFGRRFGIGDNERAETGSGDWFGWGAGAFATLVAVLLVVVSYERHPHVPDEVVYLYHARYFAEGLLTMPLPPVPAAFDVDLMSYEPTRWFSPVPPGWPAVLALGAFVGLPWLVNPLLAGIAVGLAYSLLCELYARRVARWATLLLACSPWFLFLGMSYMTHTMTLTCALVAAVGVARARRTGSIGWSVTAGVAVGATSWIRPLDGLLVGMVIALWAIGLGGRRLRLPALAALLVGTLASGAAVFPYNKALTGSGTTFPINVYTDRLYGPNSNAYGFGRDRGLGWAFDPNPGHSPIDGVINANLNIFGINTDLFGWSTGSLILVALFLTLGTRTRSDWLLMAAGGLVFTGYFFYYFSGGPDFGARYWFPVIIPLVALSARGLQVLEGLMGPRAPLAVAMLMVMGVTVFIPWRAIDKYHGFRGMRADVRRLAAQRGFGADLVLVAGKRFPDYASAAIENPIDLRGPAAIYAWDRDPAVRADVLRAYPDRRVWLVQGPSLTGNGYRVLQGPLAAAEVLADEGTR